jgi:hypothetical protein
MLIAKTGITSIETYSIVNAANQAACTVYEQGLSPYDENDENPDLIPEVVQEVLSQAYLDQGPYMGSHLDTAVQRNKSVYAQMRRSRPNMFVLQCAGSKQALRPVIVAALN